MTRREGCHVAISFVFASINSSWSLPEAYEGAAYCEMSSDERDLLRALAMLSRVKASAKETAD